ncbi:sigma-E processing peptidase SpoIIGA [Mobilitalea sibirica]|uniref:Sporulation sigma-E factor-processing peptidase n=1 Tax=Mobilitalea sibirica TaxID=1462919 RepID=A0A8J7H3D6_9FIRM|nr:sigma-E processing peptidase SpoIIGA [Mobilitalea sibirica]MBH1941370.1 sigma-E processing peptidase SpoIIGA [Mobilitalea sibirica]
MYLEVYPDIIFILNFIVDFILIFTLKKVNRKNSSLFRMALAAGLGGLSAVIVGVFLWMNMLLRFLLLYIITSILMIFIAFGRLKFMDLLKQVIVLNLITYFVGGLMNSIYYYTNFRLYLMKLGEGISFSNISWKFVGCVFLILIPVAALIIWMLRWYKNNVPLTYEVELVLDGRKINTRGLLDTGNCLYDPIYKRPVMVMEDTLMEDLLSSEFRKDIEDAKHYLEGDDYETNQWNMNAKHLLRLRFIPYQSVGKSGMMLGINLDKVLIHTGKETICNEKVIAAICDCHLSTKDNYHVILHKELL